MAWAVSCRHLTADYQVLPQVNTCQIYGGQSGKGDRFFSEYFGLCQYHSINFSYSVIHIHAALTKGQMGKAWELFKEQGSFREGALGREVLSLFLCFKGLTSACCE